MSRGKNKRGQFKKTPQESHAYQHFIAESSYNPDATLPVNNSMLVGSSDVGDNFDEIAPSAPIKRTPPKYILLDWLKKNIFPAIITTIVIAIGTAVFTHSISIAVMKEQISSIEKEIATLEETCVSVDTLDLKLKNIKTELDSTTLLSLNDIEWKIKEIEKEIEKLQTD